LFNIFTDPEGNLNTVGAIFQIGQKFFPQLLMLTGTF